MNKLDKFFVGMLTFIVGVLSFALFINGLYEVSTAETTLETVDCYDNRGNIINEVTCTQESVNLINQDPDVFFAFNVLLFFAGIFFTMYGTWIIVDGLNNG